MVKISIVTAVYNGERHLEETILSVVNQGYKNLEYIVVDGASTDRTLDIIDSYKDRIDLTLSEPDKGISDAYNKGIMLASGDVIGIISSDDYLLPGSLQAVDDAYSANPSADVFFGSHISIDCARNSVLRILPGNLQTFRYRMAIGHPPAFVTSACYKKYGLFKLEFKYAMDYDLMLRFYVNGAYFHRIDKDLVVVRMGGANQRNRLATLIEMKNISLDFGGNFFRIYYEFFLKKIKDLMGRSFFNSTLLSVLREYVGRTKQLDPSRFDK